MIEEIEREEIYDFLEHHGVAGMKWGVRNARSSSSPKKPKTPEQKKATRDKVLKGVEIAGVVAAGAIAASYLIKRHKNTKISAIRNVQKNAHIDEIIKANRDHFMSSIARDLRTNRISPESANALRGSLERNLTAHREILRKSMGR